MTLINPIFGAPTSTGWRGGNLNTYLVYKMTYRGQDRGELADMDGNLCWTHVIKGHGVQQVSFRPSKTSLGPIHSRLTEGRLDWLARKPNQDL